MGFCEFFTDRKCDMGVSCGVLHGAPAVALAITGTVAAIVATTATVATVILTATLFAAPALVVGALTFTLLSIPSLAECFEISTYMAINAAAFALLSAAAIVGGVVLGILSPALMITFIVAASLFTIGLLVLATIACCNKEKSSSSSHHHHHDRPHVVYQAAPSGQHLLNAEM